MICPKCGGGGKVYCTMCKGTGLYHEEDGITNEEWLRSCTTEQLAKFLMRKARFFELAQLRLDSVKFVIEWLKGAHKE